MAPSSHLPSNFGLSVFESCDLVKLVKLLDHPIFCFLYVLSTDPCDQLDSIDWDLRNLAVLRIGILLLHSLQLRRATGSLEEPEKIGGAVLQ